MPAEPVRSRTASSFPLPALALYGVATLTLYLLAVLFAAALPMPIDPIEATVSQLSWLALHGHPVYTALDAAGRYSLLYGPMCYLPYGAALAILGPSIVSLKIAVVVFNLLLLGSIYLVFRRLLPVIPSLAATGFVACGFTPHLMTMFLIRGDVLLALSVAIALLAASGAPSRLRLPLFCIASGCAIDIKFTAIFYLLFPLYLLSRTSGVRTTIAALTGTAAAALLPFALPGISLRNYLLWLHEAARHPLDPRFFAINIALAAILLVPVLFVVLQTALEDRGRAFLYLRTHVGLIAVIALSVLGSAITGSKVGAGRSHLATTALVCAYLAVYVGREIGWCPRPRPLLRYAPPVFAVVLVAPLLKQLVELKPICLARRSYALAVTADIDSIERSHPRQTIEIGYGQTANPLQPLSPLSYFRPQLVFRGNPVSFDAGALFDMGLSGETLPPATVAAMANCSTTLWLIPANEAPFEVTNIYFNDTHAISNKLFNAAFRQAFLAHYTNVGHSEFYDLWQCSRSSK